jgi:predicted RecA/RadA family phage recombinase
MSVYVGKNVSVTITKTQEGDMGAFIAQEVTFEPRIDVEAVDALGSDTVQYWASGLKSYQGTLREMLQGWSRWQEAA